MFVQHVGLISKEQETLVQKAGLLWIMGAGGGRRDNLPSIMLLHSGPTLLTVLVCDPAIQGLQCLLNIWKHQPVSSKAHPKVHPAISSINAGPLRDRAVLSCLLFAFIIWWRWPVKLEGQQVLASLLLTKDENCPELFLFHILTFLTPFFKSHIFFICFCAPSDDMTRYLNHSEEWGKEH